MKNLAISGEYSEQAGAGLRWGPTEERQAAQAGGMSETDCCEVALDQAAYEAVQNEHAKAMRAVKLPVADSLKEAKAILTDALCHNPQHDEPCEARRFALLNRCCPPAHPIWKDQPPCTCWVGRLAGWLKSNSEI